MTVTSVSPASRHACTSGRRRIKRWFLSLSRYCRPRASITRGRRCRAVGFEDHQSASQGQGPRRLTDGRRDGVAVGEVMQHLDEGHGVEATLEATGLLHEVALDRGVATLEPRAWTSPPTSSSDRRDRSIDVTSYPASSMGIVYRPVPAPHSSTAPPDRTPWNIGSMARHLSTRESRSRSLAWASK